MMSVVGHTEATAELDWLAGARFAADLPSQVIELDATDGTGLPDLLETVLPVMSDRLLDALSRGGADNIDVYPVVLRRADTGQRWDHHKAVNVIGNIDAVDMERSRFTRTPTGAAEFESIVIDPRATGGSRCFRLAQGPIHVVVDEQVAKAVAAVELTAVLLQRTEDYDGF